MEEHYEGDFEEEVVDEEEELEYLDDELVATWLRR